MDNEDEAIETFELSGLMKDHPKTGNRIWVGDIDDGAAKNFIEKVLEITEKDEKAPIMVLIDSYGGSVHALMAMVGFMDSVPNPFITVALGKAMSAGACLLAHGDGRFASPSARIMIHESSGAAFGHIDDSRISMAEWENNNEWLLGLLSKDMGKTVEQLNAMFTDKTRDIYMSAQQALDAGVIDHVGIPAIKSVPVMDTVYEISLLQNSKKPSALRQLTKPAKPNKKKAKK